MRRVQSGQSAQVHGQRAGRPTRRRAVQIFRRLDRPHRARANCRTPSRRGRKASSATSSSPNGNGATPDKYLHDLISTDKRNPTVNAYGKLYGSPEYSTDDLPILDPVTNTVIDLHGAGARPRDAASRSARAMPRPKKPMMPSAYWGDRKDLGHARQQPQHDVRREGPGVADRRRCAATTNPAFCKEGSDHPSAKLFPLNQSRSPARRCSIRRR